RHEDPVNGKLYSDMNALLLKYIIEEVSGFSFEEYLHKNVFAVLGMKETFSTVPKNRVQDCLNYNYEHQIDKDSYIIQKDAVPGTAHDPKARLLMMGGMGLQGHAGLFSSSQDMVRFAQGLLRGDLLDRKWLLEIGKNRTGKLVPGQYRQFLGFLCFAKSPVQYLSELPQWMGPAAFGIAGYTGNHIAIDPEIGAFDILLGNRCHMRVSKIEPMLLAKEKYSLSREGAGWIKWPDGRQVKSSFQYVHQKDELIHNPVYHELKKRSWI
ncbi:MAG: serine hydrolase, partial [Clostridiales bacterium]|nr:serine hydrolase [Clostridiales bacterium]